ncbi:MAG: hypothetical protein ACK4MQ_00775 [Hyphomonas sp.]
MSLNAVNASSLDDLVRQFGGVGLTVPPRPNRTKEEKEAYLARRLFLNLAKEQRLSFPLSITQSDSPDFVVDASDGTWFLEITEATSEADQREMTLAPDAPQLIGHSGGRGADGYFGAQPETEVIADINAAIDRKKRKAYASNRCSLLVYINSNPGMVVHMSEVLRRLPLEMIEHSFRDVFLISGSEIYEAHRATGVEQ